MYNGIFYDFSIFSHCQLKKMLMYQNGKLKYQKNKQHKIGSAKNKFVLMLLIGWREKTIGAQFFN